MAKDSGTLSIDFIAGFSIFIIAFVWVLSLIPGLLIGLQAYDIDYDAVAYRTGVILVEDPGETVLMNITTPWESLPPDDVSRFGFAISRDTPNILSDAKINRFFDTSTFTSEDDYREKAIFGDYPYHFNISLLDLGLNVNHSVGSPLPEGYGYIRRLVKIKGPSNATINVINNANYYNTTPADRYNPFAVNHTYSIIIDTPLLYTQKHDPAYQIDPVKGEITINITGLNDTPMKSNPEARALLSHIRANGVDRPDINLSVDGAYAVVPVQVRNNLSLRIAPAVFQNIYEGIYDPTLYQPVLVNLSFDLDRNSTFLNNTYNPARYPYRYDYNPANVTQPQLRDAVVEVAIW